MSQIKIDVFKALRAEENALIAENTELRNTRLPELETRANTASISVQQAKITLSQAYDDVTFAAAKQSLEDKEGELRDAQLMMANVESRSKTICSLLIPQVMQKKESAHRAMWEEKYNEVMATLPPLDAESLLIIEKLDSILRHIDPHKHRLGIGYGVPITDAQGQPTQQKVDEATTLLWTEMGINE